MSNPTYHNCRGGIHYWFKQNFFFCIFFPCLFLEEEMWTKAHIPGRQVREARSWDEDPADTGRKLNGQSQAALPLTSTHSPDTGSFLLFFATILQPTKLRTFWESWGKRKSCDNTVHNFKKKKKKKNTTSKSCDLKILHKRLQDSWAAGRRGGASNLEFVTRAWKKIHVSRGNTSDLPTKAEIVTEVV